MTDWMSYLPSSTDNYTAWAGTGPNAKIIYDLADDGYKDPITAFRDAVEAAVTVAAAPVDVEILAAEALRIYGPRKGEK